MSSASAIGGSRKLRGGAEIVSNTSVFKEGEPYHVVVLRYAVLHLVSFDTRRKMLATYDRTVLENGGGVYAV